MGLAIHGVTYKGLTAPGGLPGGPLSPTTVRGEKKSALSFLPVVRPAFPGSSPSRVKTGTG